MTTDDIISGLECCATMPCSNCGDCPYEEYDCKQGLLEDALSCINSLSANIANHCAQYKQFAETQLKELLSALYQRTGEQGFTIYRKDVVELANDYGYKEEDLNGKQ